MDSSMPSSCCLQLWTNDHLPKESHSSLSLNRRSADVGNMLTAKGPRARSRCGDLSTVHARCVSRESFGTCERVSFGKCDLLGSALSSMS